MTKCLNNTIIIGSFLFKEIQISISFFLCRTHMVVFVFKNCTSKYQHNLYMRALFHFFWNFEITIFWSFHNRLRALPCSPNPRRIGYLALDIDCSRPSSTKPPWDMDSEPWEGNTIRLSFASRHIYLRISLNCMDIQLPSFSKLVDRFTLAKLPFLV